MKKNIQSELISERVNQTKMENASSVPLDYQKRTDKYGIQKEIYEIHTTMQERIYGLKKGKYTLISFDQYGLTPTMDQYFIDYLAKCIKPYLTSFHNLLVIGLGNRHISADSIGPKVLQYILPTRYLAKQKILSIKNKMSALSTSVYALTGIDSFDIVDAVAKTIHADCIIAIDSLCASDYHRLGTSFQIHDAGFMPGQGLGNKRKRISKDKLGIKVITIGVPLVMYASSMCDDLDEELVITLKDIDDISDKISRYIGLAISKAVTNLSISEIENWLTGR